MIKKQLLADFVGNRIFNVEFIKKDGSIRTMNARLGVTRYVKGNGPAKPPHLITVYDMNAKAYRCFSQDRVLSIKCNKIKFNF